MGKVIAQSLREHLQGKQTVGKVIAQSLREHLQGKQTEWAKL